MFETAPVQGTWRRLSSPDDVLALMDTTAEGVVACVADAGATFLAPIFDELTAVVCLSGTPLSHIGKGDTQEVVNELHNATGAKLAVLAVGAGLLAPIVEELLFRACCCGRCYGGCRRRPRSRSRV